jgi:4-diphosphocytidyl-2C-methyl-D-erythritol kinase
VSAGLSGSGSAVYGYFSSRKAAEWASAKVSSADVVFNVVTETCAAR